MGMSEKDLIGKTIESVEVDGYGIEMRFTDGTVLEYDASDGGYSCWDITKDDNTKEQETVEPVLDEKTGRIWLCGNCGSYVGFEDNDPHDPNEFDKYCRECGRPVLWEGR